ncbi:ADP-heptose synthase [Candidatus Gastranaerophilus sp. (ex Termes propinquus)]|nr:ADP-heptose synthase [Candidatus Gastranaerophilus sp. (ex Termes propinquus)]
MTCMDKEKLGQELKKLKNPKMLVVGDFGIDEMVYGLASRISREAPVLILEHSHTKIILGTASNAANNISALNGGKVSAMGTYGDDYHAPILLNTLELSKIDTQYMLEDKTRKTITKTRISGSSSQSVVQQIVRIDRQTSTPLLPKTEAKVIENLKKAIPECDGVILSDYHLGFLTDNIIRAAIEISKANNKIIVADIQKNFEKYKGVDAITPNQPDTEKFLGYSIKDDVSLKKAGEDIIKALDLKCLLLTRGDNGMALFKNDSKHILIPAFNKKEVFDVTGAGDTVVATFALALCAGLEPEYAAIVGNLAASIVIRHFGCHTTSIDELESELKSLKETVCV